jgi:hypothetical protein
MLNTLSGGDFARHLHELFHVCLAPEQAEAALDIELVEVTDLGDAPTAEHAPRRPFSLIFRDAQRRYLPQRIYPLEHATLGRLEIFLVPIGPDAHGMRFQAIFG